MESIAYDTEESILTRARFLAPGKERMFCPWRRVIEGIKFDLLQAPGQPSVRMSQLSETRGEPVMQLMAKIPPRPVAHRSTGSVHARLVSEPQDVLQRKYCHVRD